MSKLRTMAEIPQISIVMPSLNQGAFIEDALDSILAQSYQNLQLIVIDGGSRDGTVNILKDYDQYLDYWTSEPDAGQSDAIASGLRMATGELLTWLNCDDVLLPGSLELAAEAYERGHHIVYGNYVTIDERGRIIEAQRVPHHCVDSLAKRGFWAFNSIGTFFSRFAYAEVGGIIRDLHYVMDADMYMRFAMAGFSSFHTMEYVAGYRRHEKAKTVAGAMDSKLEHLQVRNKYWQPSVGWNVYWWLLKASYMLCQLLSGSLLMYYETRKFQGQHWKDFASPELQDW